jgi:molybdopterin converting factor small subunit
MNQLMPAYLVHRGLHMPTEVAATHIEIKLFATLQPLMPARAQKYPVVAGMTVKDLLVELNIPENEAKLIFINGKKGGLDTRLDGGERVGIFPPVGGG